MRIYDILPEKERLITDTMCPYKIGDRLKITRVVFGCDGVQKDIFDATVIDVSLDPTREDTLLESVPLYMRDCVTVDMEKVNVLSPHFIVRFEYNILQPRSKWWKLWEERKYEATYGSVTVNKDGFYVSKFTRYINYTIEKVIDEKSEEN